MKRKNKIKENIRRWLTGTTVTLMVLVASIGAATIGMAGCAHKEADTEVDDRPGAYYSRVKSVNKLVLGQMAVSKMATLNDITLSEAKGLRETTAALLDAVKIGDRKAAYSYSTYLRAYIHLSGLRPEDVRVDETAKRIDLTLPDVTVEIQGRDVEIREDHYRVSGLRSNVNAPERAKLKEKMNTALKAEMEKRPEFKEQLKATARRKAENYFQSLLGQEGYTVVINFG